MANLKRNFLYNTGYQILQIITPLVTTPYLARVLGPDLVGVYSFSYSVANYFVLFAVLGMTTYGVRTIAAVKDDREARSEAFWSTYASQLIVALPVFFIYIAYSFFAINTPFPIAIAWSMWVFSSVIDVSWLLFGMEEFRIPTIRSTLVKLATVILILTLVRTGEDLWIYACITAGGFLATQAVLWPFIGRYVNRVKVSWAQVRAHFIPNLRLFVPVIAISVYTLMDRVLLGVMSTDTQVGYFDYAEKIINMPLAVITALGAVMLPHMSALLNQGQKERAFSLIENTVWIMLAAALALGFGIAAVAPEFVPSFLGDDFAGCTPVVIMLVVILPIMSLTNVIGQQYLLPTFQDTRYTLSVVIGAVVNVGVNLVLIPAMGAIGAAIATVICEFAVSFTQCIYVRKDLPLGTYIKNAVPFLVIGAIMAIVIRLVAGPLMAALPDYRLVCVLIEVALGFTVFTGLSIAWCVATKNVYGLNLLGWVRNAARSVIPHPKLKEEHR